MSSLGGDRELLQGDRFFRSPATVRNKSYATVGCRPIDASRDWFHAGCEDAAAAKKAATAATAEAKKNGWFMAIAVVDPAGTLVYYEKADNTQLGSANVAVGKARSAALYKRPTKALQDALAAGGNGLRILALEGAVPVEGGLPLLHEGKLVGAIGVSGDTSEHDG